MTIETATFVSDLNASLPTFNDPKSEGDDHLRLMKATIKATFPNVGGAMTATHTLLSNLGSTLFADGTGKLGIGVSPTDKLTVGATTDSATAMSVNASGTSYSQFTVNASGAGALVLVANASGATIGGIAPNTVGLSAITYRLVFVVGGAERLSLAPSGNATFSNGVTAPSFNGYLATGNISQFTNDAGYITSGTGGAVAWASITGKPTAVSYFTNDSGYITGVTSGQVTGALGFTPYNSTNPSGYITGVTSGAVTGALGFTPYNATNPASYITSAGTSAACSGNAATATAVSGTSSNGYGTRTVSTAAPSGGADGDVWYQY